MKTLYLECNMGAAGDMLMAALYELLEDQPGFLRTMNRLFPGVEVKAQRTATCGITGTRMDVAIQGREEHSHDVALGAAAPACHHHGHETAQEESHHDHDHASHHHTAPEDIAAMLDGLDVPAEVKAAAKAVYHRIAEAESRAHGVPVTEIHFHEVGMLDAMADITGVCLALHLLHPDRIVASPIHLGSGQVRCSHGIMPVPAPATAYLLEGLPCYTGDIQGELCTPTGAALLSHFVHDFGPMPVISPEKIGYGVGKKSLPAANCVRAFLGDAGVSQQAEIVELCCHIDDMTAEAMAYAGEQLLFQGALDVSAAPMTMKKGRPGTAMTVLCKPRDEERLAQMILRDTVPAAASAIS